MIPLEIQTMRVDSSDNHFGGLYMYIFSGVPLGVYRPTLDKPNGCFMFQTFDSNFISRVALE